jgi:hypothetical protein
MYAWTNRRLHQRHHPRQLGSTKHTAAIPFELISIHIESATFGDFSRSRLHMPICVNKAAAAVHFVAYSISSNSSRAMSCHDLFHGESLTALQPVLAPS